MSHPYTLSSGRYLLIQAVGFGGMATVFQAWDRRLRVWRAIKLLKPSYSKKKKVIERFLAEARMMANLEHDHIVRVYDVARDEPSAYLVMELVRGGSLVEWMERYGAMPPKLVLRVAFQLCGALEAAHARGVIHRDIKPHNILLDEAGRCRVTDFGIARAGEIDRERTRDGAVMGTWGYMSPEQRNNAKQVDVRSDIYSVGATMVALATNAAPNDLFAADQDHELLNNIPELLRPMIQKATAYHPDQRYQTAAAFRAAITDLLHDLGGGHEAATLVPETMAPLKAPDREMVEKLLKADKARREGTTDDSVERSRSDQGQTGATLEPPERRTMGTAQVPMTIDGGTDLHVARGNSPAEVIALCASVVALVVVLWWWLPMDEDPLQEGTVFRSVPVLDPRTAPEPPTVSPQGPTTTGVPDAQHIGSPDAVPSDPAAKLTPNAPAVASADKTKPLVAQPDAAAQPTASKTETSSTQASGSMPVDPRTAEANATPSDCVKTASAKVSPNAEKITFQVTTCLGDVSRPVVVYRSPDAAWIRQTMRVVMGRHVTSVRAKGMIEWYVETSGSDWGSPAMPKVLE